ncbi:MAG TPA: hypothetical protein VMR70_12780, partial [Flavisolibacter sp.]|nr:hypothetical protein [Flavisolibacter sp.]
MKATLFKAFGVWGLAFGVVVEMQNTFCCLSYLKLSGVFDLNNPNTKLQTPNKIYLTNAVATPPSTFNTFPVDLLSRPPTKAKQAAAIS